MKKAFPINIDDGTKSESTEDVDERSQVPHKGELDDRANAILDDPLIWLETHSEAINGNRSPSRVDGLPP